MKSAVQWICAMAIMALAFPLAIVIVVCKVADSMTLQIHKWLMD